ncbi:MAG: hypothetical protein ACTHMM_21265 [Agriterribacter sp.]
MSALLPDEYKPLPENLTKERLAELLRTGETTIENVGKALNLRKEEIRFSELYYEEFAGDGLSTVADVYGFNLNIKRQREQAKSVANRLLGNPDILLLINAQVSAKGLNDEHVDSVLSGLISQKQDLKVAITGVKLYNDITNRAKRIEDEAKKNVFDYSRLSDDKLIMLIQLLEEARINNGEHPFIATEIINNEINLSANDDADAEIMN